MSVRMRYADGGPPGRAFPGRCTSALAEYAADRGATQYGGGRPQWERSRRCIVLDLLAPELRRSGLADPLSMTGVEEHDAALVCSTSYDP